MLQFKLIAEAEVKQLCKARGMYETPELNETLILHGLGIMYIGNLSNYINITCLMLNGNQLSSIEDLLQFPNLKYLNLNDNCVKKAEFDRLLENAPFLEELHMCGNKLAHFGVTFRHKLRVLNLRKNNLTEFPDFSCLEKLEIVDIRDNFIHQENMFDSLRSLLPASILQLYMHNNEFIAKEKNYRKKCINMIPSLIFLDASAVSAEERELAEACLIGLSEEEVRKKHAQIRRAARDEILLSFRRFQRNSDELVQLAREIEFIVS